MQHDAFISCNAVLLQLWHEFFVVFGWCLNIFCYLPLLLHFKLAKTTNICHFFCPLSIWIVCAIHPSRVQSADYSLRFYTRFYLQTAAGYASAQLRETSSVYLNNAYKSLSLVAYHCAIFLTQFQNLILPPQPQLQFCGCAFVHYIQWKVHPPQLLFLPILSLWDDVKLEEHILPLHPPTRSRVTKNIQFA